MSWRNSLMLLVMVVVMMAGGLAHGGAPVAGQGATQYPDLRTKPPRDLHFDRLSDGTHVLRFTNVVWNAGQGRLELEGNPHPKKDGSKKIYQNLYDAPVGGNQVSHKVVASDVIYHPSHNHYHFQNFASYLLLKKDASGVYRETTKKGTKTSFCILDSTRMRGSYPEQYTDCSMTLQGLSVGWGDGYDYQLPEQWVVLGRQPLADGIYAVRSPADPKNVLAESRNNTNVAKTCFEVRQGTITVIPC